jgi:hypothetical protein
MIASYSERAFRWLYEGNDGMMAIISIASKCLALPGLLGCG